MAYEKDTYQDEDGWLRRRNPTRNMSSEEHHDAMERDARAGRSCHDYPPMDEDAD